VLDNPHLVPAYETELLEEIGEVTKEHGLAKTFSMLPILQDQILLGIHSILIEMTASLAWAAPHLLHTIPLLGSYLTFKRGKCVHSTFHVLTYPHLTYCRLL
jgi:hypothetical protein